MSSFLYHYRRTFPVIVHKAPVGCLLHVSLNQLYQASYCRLQHRANLHLCSLYADGAHPMLAHRPLSANMLGSGAHFRFSPVRLFLCFAQGLASSCAFSQIWLSIRVSASRCSWSCERYALSAYTARLLSSASSV